MSKPHKAILDARNIYRGHAINGNGPEVPADCDLQPGSYKWNPDAGRFEPIPKEYKNVDVDEIARAIRCLAGVGIAVRDGKPLPAETLAWLAEYEKSMDAQG